MTRAAPLLLCLTACATPQGTHYRVQADVYVQDSAQLCRDAWELARERFGLGVAEMVTMTGGEFVTSKCLAVLYQCLAPVGAVSAGIYVTEGDK